MVALVSLASASLDRLPTLSVHGVRRTRVGGGEMAEDPSGVQPPLGSSAPEYSTSSKKKSAGPG